MFRRKKPSADDASRPLLRGRSSATGGGDAAGQGQGNPLARRFQPDTEPATIELAAPASVRPEPGSDADPQTKPLQTRAADLNPVISHDPETGKFYIHPGDPGLPVTLQGEPVRAPTELRRGDSVGVGSIEIHFGSRG